MIRFRTDRRKRVHPVRLLGALFREAVDEDDKRYHHACHNGKQRQCNDKFDKRKGAASVTLCKAMLFLHFPRPPFLSGRPCGNNFPRSAPVKIKKGSAYFVQLPLFLI